MCMDLDPLPWQQPINVTKEKVRFRSFYGFRSVEEHLDLDQEKEARASEAPTIASFEEHPTSPTEPTHTSYRWHDDDSDSVASRVRKGRATSTVYGVTNKTGSASQEQILAFESDNKTLADRPPSKIRISTIPTTKFPGPLDLTDLKPSFPNAFDEPGGSESCPIKIEGDSGNHIDLPNLTNQETFSVPFSAMKGTPAKPYSVSKLLEPVKPDNDQGNTYHWPSHHAGRAELPDSQVREHASTSSKTMSLVDRLRKAAAERDRGLSNGGLPMWREKIRRSSSLSSMSESTSEYLGYPVRPSTKAPLDSSSKELPIRKRQKREMWAAPATSRKSAFVYNSTPELESSMIDYVEYTYKLFHEDSTEDECWLHPSPPAPQFERGTRAIEHEFRWLDGHRKIALKVNFAMVVLLVNHRLTEVQKQGYVTSCWQASRICGNWTCCNWHHFAIEPKGVSTARTNCFKFSRPCRHAPRCLTNKKCYPQSQSAITRRRAISHHLSHASQPPALFRAKDMFRIQKSSPLEKAFRRREHKPSLSSPPNPTRPASPESMSAALFSSKSTRSPIAENSSHGANQPTTPALSVSPENNLHTPKSPTPPTRSTSPENTYYTPEPLTLPKTSANGDNNLRIPDNPPPVSVTITNDSPFEPQETSSSHNQSCLPPKVSIASKAFEIFHPAAQNLKSAFRTTAIWLAWRSKGGKI